MRENTTYRDKRRGMTPHIYNLKQHKVNEEYRNLGYILGAIKKLGNATTGEILMQVNKETKDYNQTLKEEAQRLQGSRDDMLTSRQINNYINKNKRNAVGLRTVQRAVGTLFHYGLVYKHASRHYSLSFRSLKELRYFPHDFADAAASAVFLLGVKTVEQSVEEMITRFGAYIFFTFIEAVRPPMTADASNNKGILNKEKLLDSWLENAIPIRKMYDWFVKIYTVRNPNSSWERNGKIAEKLTYLFENKYPEIYKIFKETKLDILGELEPTTEQSLERLKKASLLEPGKSMKWPYTSNNQVVADLVPPDWDEQLTS
jgi:hypothetical protein